MLTVAAAFAISLLSLAGILLSRRHTGIGAFYAFFLPVSIGMFLGVTFFELLPEAFGEHEFAGIAVAAGFLGFFLLSRLLREYHHHHHADEADAEHRGRGLLILMGDGVHNFADGVVIAAAFAIEPAVGLAAAAAIALHELPQEIAEFSILLRAGYSRARALALNFLSASSVTLGAAVGVWLLASFEHLFGFLLGIAAGNLLYIAASDLLPELANDAARSSRGFRRQFALVLGACALIGALVYWSHEALGGHEHEQVHAEAEHGHEDD